MAERPPLLPYRFFAADPPELPVRREGDAGAPDGVVRAVVMEEGPRGVALAGAARSGEAVAIRVELVREHAARVVLALPSAPRRRETLVCSGPPADLPVRLERSPNRVRLAAAGIGVRIDLEPFRMVFTGGSGEVLLEQTADGDATDCPTALPFGLSRAAGRFAAFHDSFAVAPDEHFFGFGEKFTELDKRGQRLELWNYDAYGAHCERSYKNVPFFASTRGYGFFVDTTACARFDMAASNHGVFTVAVPDSALDYTVIAGPRLKDVVSRYSALVGKGDVPPKWAFGVWVSGSFQPDTQEAVLARARRLRRERIPADVMHIDCYWQRFGRWSELLWDRAAFPDPEGMIRELKSLGFKLSLWMNPYFSIESERFAEARDRGFLLRNPDGSPCVAKLWGDFHPPVGILDVTHPGATAWFQDLLRPLLRMGVDVFKTDFGEGVPAGAVSFSGKTGDLLHNLYPLLYNDAVAAVTAEETGRHGLVWARSSWAGGQRHAAQWAGDPNCTFRAMASTLRGGLSLGMCGHTFWSHDMGGFHGTPSPELFARWCQFGFLSPLSRAHGRTSRLPWEFGPEALRIFREYARLRYRLLPYIYTSAVSAAEAGLPLLRAMVLEFPDDPAARRCDLQYMLGEDLLVAPLFSPAGPQAVYLPAGEWFDYWSRETLAGPVTLRVAPPLDRLPLFVRSGALLPAAAPAVHLDDGPFGLVTFEAFITRSGAGELRDEDGRLSVAAELSEDRLEIALRGAGAAAALRMFRPRGAPPVRQVVVNGATLAERPGLRLAAGAAAGWASEKDGALAALLPWPPARL